MFPTILSRRFAPAASVQSSYLTLSGCQLLSQGGPRVRQARHLCSHDCQRAPRKLSVHAVVLCASCFPLYCPGASRPRQACSRLTSRFRVAPHYTVQALCWWDLDGSVQSSYPVVLPHAFGFLSRAYAAAAYAIGFVAVVLGRFRQAPKKAVAPLELFDGRRELRHAAADTVLKKVEKHKHVQHVHMTTRGVNLSQLLGREG